MTSPTRISEPQPDAEPPRRGWVAVAVAWALVALPIAWGVYRTLKSAVVLFR
jgi:hypothetical protein